MPVGNGGKFTPETRAMYELVLEMQTVHFHRAGVLEANTDLFKDISQSPQARSALGRGAAPLPPHTRAWLPETRYLQSRDGGGRSTRVRC